MGIGNPFRASWGARMERARRGAPQPTPRPSPARPDLPEGLLESAITGAGEVCTLGQSAPDQTILVHILARLVRDNWIAQDIARSTDYTGLQWTEVELRRELLHVREKYDRAAGQITRLGEWLLEHAPGAIDGSQDDTTAVGIAIRLLSQPSERAKAALGRVLDVVSAVAADPGGCWFNDGWRETRQQLKDALALASSEHDRSRWVERAEYDRTCQLVAKMHEAAVGEVRGPTRGVVQDITDLRSRMLAAEEALGYARAGEQEHQERADRLAERIRGYEALIWAYRDQRDELSPVLTELCRLGLSPGEKEELVDSLLSLQISRELTGRQAPNHE